VERFDLPPLRGGGRRGNIIHRRVGKAVGNPLGCLYVGCAGCGAARSLLLFGYVSLYCLVTLLICICLLPLPSHRGLPQRSSDRDSPPAALVGA
jgi:hypothetical protein